MNKLLLLVIILLVVTAFPLLFHVNESLKMREKYTNLGSSKYPISENNVLLQNGNSYPITGKNGVSNRNASNIWWYKPDLPISSYKQLTNNLRYFKNPDIGTCSSAEFCGALYKDHNYGENEIHPMDPVQPHCGARVNYYYTPQNLLI